MNINLNSFTKELLPYLITILIAFIISSIVYIILPKTAPVVIEDNNNKFPYEKYYVSNSFKKNKEKTKQVKVDKPQQKEYQLLKNIELKAIFALPNNRGFITISEKSSSITHTLSIGDVYKNYKLTKIYPKYVIFEKNGNEYKLSMFDEKSTNIFIDAIKKKPNTLTKSNKQVEIKKVGAKSFNLTRSIVNSYVDNYENIWKEIAIKEIEKNGKIDGFKVRNLSKSSIFKKIGLKIGDIIKKVNNIPLLSYKDAFNIYENVEDINFLTVELLRNGKPMELHYEIK